MCHTSVSRNSVIHHFPLQLYTQSFHSHQPTSALLLWFYIAYSHTRSVFHLTTSSLVSWAFLFTLWSNRSVVRLLHFFQVSPTQYDTFAVHLRFIPWFSLASSPILQENFLLQMPKKPSVSFSSDLLRYTNLVGFSPPRWPVERRTSSRRKRVLMTTIEWSWQWMRMERSLLVFCKVHSLVPQVWSIGFPRKTFGSGKWMQGREIDRKNILQITKLFTMWILLCSERPHQDRLCFCFSAHSLSKFLQPMTGDQWHGDRVYVVVWGKNDVFRWHWLRMPVFHFKKSGRTCQ